MFYVSHGGAIGAILVIKKVVGGKETGRYANVDLSGDKILYDALLGSGFDQYISHPHFIHMGERDKCPLDVDENKDVLRVGGKEFPILEWFTLDE